MGRALSTDNVELIRNGDFPKVWPWSPVPPWVIAGGKAQWHFDAATLGNDLTQLTYAGASETYACHFQAEISVQGRTFTFHLADVKKTWNTGIGVYDESFDLTPTADGDVRIEVGLAWAPGSLFDIWNISIVGMPSGDPTQVIVFEYGFRPREVIRTEYVDLENGQEWFNICSAADHSKCLIKSEP